MPECTRCGNRVSEQFAKVMWSDAETIPACPECEDAKIMDGDLHIYRG